MLGIQHIFRPLMSNLFSASIREHIRSNAVCHYYVIMYLLFVLQTRDNKFTPVEILGDLYDKRVSLPRILESTMTLDETPN